MYKNLRINKTFTLVIPFFIYLSLISIYISSLGLMDDFNYINMNFFQNSPSYVEFIIGDIDSGGFRPFLPFQITLNNIGYYLFSVKGYFLFNLFFLFLILEFFYITMKEYFNLDKFVYYFVFFSWPYSSDLVIHPSLQEKFIIFAISVFLFSIKNNKVFLSRFSAFCIPLIKIQSLIFIPFIYSVVKTHKNKKFYISYFLVSTFMVLFIFFNQPETYFNSRLDFSSVFKQTFLSPVNAVNLFLIVVTIFLSIKTNLKNKNLIWFFI